MYNDNKYFYYTRRRIMKYFYYTKQCIMKYLFVLYKKMYNTNKYFIIQEDV